MKNNIYSTELKGEKIMANTQYIYDMANFDTDHSALDKVLQAVQAGASERIVTADDVKAALDDAEKGLEAYILDGLHVCCCPKADLKHNQVCKDIPEETFIEAVHEGDSWKITRTYREARKCEALYCGCFMTLAATWNEE